MFELLVFGEPVAQGRPRFSSASGYTRAYDPAKSREFKQVLQLMARQKMEGLQLMEGPLHLVLHVKRTPPKSWSKRRTQEALELGLGIESKPDLDNYVKLVLDALNGVVFRDDSQVVRISASKRWADSPGMEILIQEDKR